MSVESASPVVIDYSELAGATTDELRAKIAEVRALFISGHQPTLQRSDGFVSFISDKNSQFLYGASRYLYQFRLRTAWCLAYSSYQSENVPGSCRLSGTMGLVW